MTHQTLSPQALAVINGYQALAIAGKSVTCPYYNNKKGNARAALRVQVGKGDPDEIVAQAREVALRQGVDLSNLSAEGIRDFLMQHNLGIDCSGFIVHVLDAELAAQDVRLAAQLSFPEASFVRKLLAKMRFVENVSAAVLAHDANSVVVPLSSIQPGDMIMLQGFDAANKHDHILLISEVAYAADGMPVQCTYIHSTEPTTNDAYASGIAEGMIKIVDPNQPLNKQDWKSLSDTAVARDTYTKAQAAQACQLRRLRAVS